MPQGVSILVLNCGSSSLKFSLYRMADNTEDLRFCGQAERVGQDEARWQVEDATGKSLQQEMLSLPDHAAAVRHLFGWLQQHPDLNVQAVGHRIVHGGAVFQDHCRLDEQALQQLRALQPLAPNHLPPELTAIEAVQQHQPGLPQALCFDTAFHRRMPRTAQLYALPRRFAEQGMVRYGFHGLSYEYIVQELQRRGLLPHRLIVAHLGNGASLAAIQDGTSIDTTMGFTPTSGIPMGTRTGDLDPEAVLYLLREHLTLEQVDTLVTKQSGLLGLSGSSADMRDLLEQEDAQPAAAEAIAVFCYAVRKQIGAYVAALGGVDAIVFTGGIGEHAAPIRERVCQGLDCFGIRVDSQRNRTHNGLISADTAPVAVRVLRTNEELMIARHTRGLLQQPGQRS